MLNVDTRLETHSIIFLCRHLRPTYGVGGQVAFTTPLYVSYHVSDSDLTTNRKLKFQAWREIGDDPTKSNLIFIRKENAII